MEAQIVLSTTDAPTDRPVETLDARDLPPPRPLKDTLERLVAIDDDVVLVQYNDRAPQHLYPKLEDRGYRYETIDAAEAGGSIRIDGEDVDGVVVTAIWGE
ncbi:Uncharacterized conserved protein [Halopenitus malekzadehii]|uniref:Uncharacterized conserved protein n=1 Tax=Halopenitus malekzadehii TaxID=1267564 RepID=A0A1H6ICE2_9EURY|nr:DUF2249 domain-containing protein [Halopenitus malekzadehii]SEH46015.1 Uncharacterized conserved protein [Halopenitus malekzadehii]